MEKEIIDYSKKPCGLSRREYQVLEALKRQPDNSRGARYLVGEELGISENAISVTLTRVRKKILGLREVNRRYSSWLKRGYEL